MSERNLLDAHKRELQRVLTGIRDDADGPAKKRHPSRYSPAVWSAITGKRVADWCSIGQHPIGHCIRQIHDYYGWMAKGGKHGGCAGALYRSVEFMRLAPGARDGTRSPSRNLHIEHLVPVAVLERMLRHKRLELKSPFELHSMLLGNSICVALTYQEQLNLDRAGVARFDNEAFDPDGRRVGYHPFCRYRPLLSHSKAIGHDFRIYNLVTGLEVDIEQFTFDDHLATLQAASGLVTRPGKPSLYSLELFDSRVWESDHYAS